MAGIFAGLVGFGALTLAVAETACAAERQPQVLAQMSPPGSIPDADQPDSGDSSNIAIRINRLEDALRQANGAIEQLQNENQRLEAELKRFREDVEFRLSGAKPPLTPAPGALPPVAANPPNPEPLKPRKNDAFDPGAAPGAAGAPQPLGATAPSAPLANGLEFKPNQRPAGAPLDLSSRPPISAQPAPAAPTMPSGPLPSTSGGPTVIGSGLDFADAPRQQFSAAVDAYKAGQYDSAEAQLKAFLVANSGHKLAPDATFLLGETYMQRSRPREAAEQYLKLSTDFAKSPRAPEGMMRLGQSLAQLGNTEQACATFTEVSKRYPTASSTVKKTIERELQKNHC